MIEPFLIWKRMEDELLKHIDLNEDQLFLNKALLQLVKVKIMELVRAGKVPKNYKENDTK